MTSPNTHHHVEVTRSENNTPLTELIKKHGGVSGKKAKELLNQRQVFVNGKRVWMAKHPCKTGDVVRFPLQQAKSSPQPLPILYRDANVLAVNKPAGWVSDRASDSTEALLRQQLDEPGIRALHRLDKGTSGVLLFTRIPENRESFIQCFRDQLIDKRYRVLVRGQPPRNEHTVRTPIEGKTAETRFRVLQRNRAYALIECKLLTGRTHQIRRHLAELSCTVAGDRQYNTAVTVPVIEQQIPRQMLHAHSVTFPSPVTGADIKIQAPLPGDFTAASKTLGLDGKRK